jgi:hypothetical protein
MHSRDFAAAEWRNGACCNRTVDDALRVLEYAEYELSPADLAEQQRLQHLVDEWDHEGQGFGK